MLLVCTPVTGSLKCKEWLTVRWVDTVGKLETLLYAAHSSLWTSVPGRVCCWIIGSRVAASLCCTSWTYPSAGVWLMSTIPKTHIWDDAACPRWYWRRTKQCDYYILCLCCYTVWLTLGLWLKQDSSIWTMLVWMGPVPPRVRSSWLIRRQLQISLSHWYTSTAVPFATSHSFAACVTGYCLTHQ